MEYSNALKAALGIMEELYKNGFAVVPSIPSKGMVEAGAKAGNVDAAAAERIYRAMLNAAGVVGNKKH